MRSILLRFFALSFLLAPSDDVMAQESIVRERPVTVGSVTAVARYRLIFPDEPDHSPSSAAPVEALRRGVRVVGEIRPVTRMERDDAVQGEPSASAGSGFSATLFGGNDYDRPAAIARGADGDIYVVGTTFSPDFPVTAGAFDTTMIMGDAFVSRHAPDGTIRWITLVGGSGGEGGNGIAIDADGSVVISGLTNSTDFPTTPGAAARTYADSIDAFVARITSDGQRLIAATYLGGAGIDAANAVAIMSDGTIVVGGSSGSAAPVGDTARVPDVGPFIAWLDRDLTRIERWRSVGGRGEDYGYGLALASDGSAWLCGVTQSNDMPVTPGAPQPTRASVDSTFDFFVAHFGSEGRTILQTYLGGSGDELGGRVAVGEDDQCWFTGTTWSGDVAGMQAHDYSGEGDLLLARFDPGGGMTGRYVGGSARDRGQGIAVGREGRIWIVGDTQSETLPSAGTSHQGSYAGGDGDGLIIAVADSTLELLYRSYLGGSAPDVLYAVAPLDSTLLLLGTSASRDIPGVVTASGTEASAEILVGSLEPDFRSDPSAVRREGSSVDAITVLRTANGVRLSGATGLRGRIVVASLLGEVVAEYDGLVDGHEIPLPGGIWLVAVESAGRRFCVKVLPERR